MTEEAEALVRLAGAIAAAQDRPGADDRLAAFVKLRLAAASPRRRWRWPVAVATVGALLVVACGWWFRPTPFALVAGAPGSIVAGPEGRVLSFTDGSRVELAAGASARLRACDASAVAFHLRQGALRADVVGHAERTWTWSAGRFRLRVLGARFALNWDDANARGSLRVDAGTVRVAGAGLSEERVIVAPAEVPLAGPPPAERAPRPAVLDPGRTPARAPRAAPREVPREAHADAPNAGALLAAADDARAAGRLDEAATALRSFVAAFARDARTPVAWFTLGRVEGDRGRHADAAAAFERAASFGDRLAVREDALAAVALSWARAGRDEPARAAAERYLRAYPAGAYGARMHEIRDGRVAGASRP